MWKDKHYQLTVCSRKPRLPLLLRQQRGCTLTLGVMVQAAGQYGLRARRSGHSHRDAGITAEEVSKPVVLSQAS